MVNKDKISVRNIARQCSLSPTTVSNVINNTGRVGEKTKRIVLDTIRKFKYEPYQNRPWFRKIKTRLIGIVSPSTATESSPFFSRVIGPSKVAANARGYNCVLYFDQEIARTTSKEFYQGPVNIPCDGMIFFCPYFHWDRSLAALKKWKIPCVLIRRQTTVPGVPAINNNDYKGIWLALEHLYKLGHRRIGMLRGQGEIDLAEREQAYTDFLKQHGLEYNPAWYIRNKPGQPDIFHGPVQELMTGRAPRPTAFISDRDSLAITLIQYLTEIGIGVPEDVAVVGYDNDCIAETSNPPLTTVNVPVEEMTTQACRILFDMIDHPEETMSMVEKLDMEIKNELVIRQSCGTLRQPVQT